MAWTGDVIQELRGVRPATNGSTILFVCGHEQFSRLSTVEALFLREAVCNQCSKPHKDKIPKIRSSISFDDVLRKLRALHKSD